MTPGNNGEHTSRAPEGDDDPFGYLYADGQAAGATPPSGSGGYGYPGPRSSYNHVRAVGERQYGQQAQGGQARGYGYPPVQAPQQAYGQPNAHYAAPEAQPGVTAPMRQAGGPGAPGTHAQTGNGGGRGRGPNTKGLLIGAIAVVAVVSVGIGAAMVFSSDGKGDDDKKQAGPTQHQDVSESPSPTGSKDDDEKPEAELPKTDAKALRLEGGTTTASDIEGAQSAGGVYVAGLDKPGAQVTWTVDGIPKSGAYTVFVGYSVPGKPAETTLGINGTPTGRKLNMDNFTGAKAGAWDKGWTKTFAFVQLNKGANTISVSCQQGDKCDAVLDRVWLKAGHVKE